MPNAINKMTGLALSGKKLLIRQDLNVPIRDGAITSDKRLQASLPTLKLALEAGASVTVMSHLGRPVEGEPDNSLSLAPVAEYLSNALGQAVTLDSGHPSTLQPLEQGIRLLENVRFWSGEKADDEALARHYAALCDIYVMDAFGTAHRAQASTHGAGLYAPVACAGPLLAGELEALAKVLENPARPLVAIVGGSKVSTKLTVLKSLAEKVDQLVVGGGIANTFIAAAGHAVGESLYEPDLVDEARNLMEAMSARGARIPVPVDVVCGKQFSEDAEAELKPAGEVKDDDMIFDIGPESSAELAGLLKQAGTIVWNGPVGVFEFDQFAAGTEAISHAIADSAAFSIAGGGDTLAALDKFGIEDKVSYISTGGGAFLEFLEGKQLPAVDMLLKRAAQS